MRYTFFFLWLTAALSGQECPFCDQELLSRQQFAENSLARALINYRPVEPGHVMVLPKRHCERFEELTGEEIQAIFRLLKRADQAIKKSYGTTNSILLQKNGISAGQSVPHVHFHYIPRHEGAAPGIGLALKFGINTWWSPMSEKKQRAIVRRLQKALE